MTPLAVLTAYHMQQMSAIRKKSFTAFHRILKPFVSAKACVIHDNFGFRQLTFWSVVSFLDWFIVLLQYNWVASGCMGVVRQLATLLRKNRTVQLFLGFRYFYRFSWRILSYPLVRRGQFWYRWSWVSWGFRGGKTGAGTPPPDDLGRDMEG